MIDSSILDIINRAPSGKYIPVDDHVNKHRIFPDEGVLGDLYTIIKTDKSDARPIVGTTEDEACLTVFMVNRSNGKATTVMEHTPTPGRQTIDNLYSCLACEEGDIIDVIMIGMLGDNQERQDVLLGVFDALDTYPNLRLSVCDLGAKSHPTAFAIDTLRSVPEDPNKPIEILSGTRLVSNMQDALDCSQQYRDTQMGYWQEYTAGRGNTLGYSCDNNR